jgi:hypothetical protein
MYQLRYAALFLKSENFLMVDHLTAVQEPEVLNM